MQCASVTLSVGLTPRLDLNLMGAPVLHGSTSFFSAGKTPDSRIGSLGKAARRQGGISPCLPRLWRSSLRNASQEGLAGSTGSRAA